MENLKIPRFVKWAGGKLQLLGQLKQFLPEKIERYFEPFVGGGALAFLLIKNYNPKEIFISDINEELINAYQVVKNNVGELILLLKEYKKRHNKEIYYKIRAEDPSLLSMSQEQPGLFILIKPVLMDYTGLIPKASLMFPLAATKTQISVLNKS